MVLTNLKMSATDFQRLSSFIYDEYGIKMTPVKKTMLESRLQKRLTSLNIPSYKEYCDFLFSTAGKQQEVIQMIDLVTTNKTDFFREPAHFEFLTTQVLPVFINHYPNRQLKVWSAGCSSGEEPYTLAMVLNEFSEKMQTIGYDITATDLSTQVLNKAVSAVYTEERIAGIPLQLKKKYFLKSKDPFKKTVRIMPQLRSKVHFARINFMDDTLDVSGDFDIIFCRNVIIYFDKTTQEKVINKLCAKLKPGGYFFLGHSESITNMRVPLEQLKPTVFRKTS
jgi:chemotaxis protein methyltransferase CheR